MIAILKPRPICTSTMTDTRGFRNQDVKMETWEALACLPAQRWSRNGIAARGTSEILPSHTVPTNKYKGNDKFKKISVSFSLMAQWRSFGGYNILTYHRRTTDLVFWDTSDVGDEMR